MKYFFVLVVFCHSALASSGDLSLDLNRELMTTVNQMPQGGAYSTGRDAFNALVDRIQFSGRFLKIDHLLKAPSFCSSATYVVFMETLERLQRSRQLQINAAALPRLMVKDEKGSYLPDGFGVWGRWNANGPGTAGLFHDLKMGDNFADDGFYEAKAGDFLKIFWTWGQGVGKNERGHSVVFTRVVPSAARGREVQKVCFWSSHGYEDGRESGMGEKCVPRSNIQEMIFSRLTIPSNVNEVLSSQFKHENTYLSSLLDTASTIEEARRETNTFVHPPLWNE